MVGRLPIDEAQGTYIRTTGCLADRACVHNVTLEDAD